MIEITATGDTTLHTAGKYCEEDILVKVPAGGSGSGGASVETCSFKLRLPVDYYSNFSQTSLMLETCVNGQINNVLTNVYATWDNMPDDVLDLDNMAGMYLEKTIENVVCGSRGIFYFTGFVGDAGFWIDFTTENDLEVEYGQSLVCNCGNTYIMPIVMSQEPASVNIMTLTVTE